MRFAPLICVCLLLGAAGMVYAGLAPAQWSLSPNASLVLALVYLEMALAPLVLAPRTGRDTATVAANLAGTAACWIAASAAVLLFTYLSPTSFGLDSRVLSLCAWLAAGGILAAAATMGPRARESARVLVIATFTLPALFHYLSVEYSGASQFALASVSPHWLLARGVLEPSWWLAGAGFAGWAAAAILCLARRRPA